MCCVFQIHSFTKRQRQLQLSHTTNECRSLLGKMQLLLSKMLFLIYSTDISVHVCSFSNEFVTLDCDTVFEPLTVVLLQQCFCKETAMHCFPLKPIIVFNCEVVVVPQV